MEVAGITGKVALVTGAAQGIGRTVAAALAERGALVAAVDQHAEGVRDLVAELRAGGHQAAAFPADASDSAAVEAMVDQIEREVGPVEILVNVAGLLRTGPIETLSSNAAGVPRMQMSAYAASKAAATMFTKCLGLEYARHNIRCNVVSP
ncbi:SDR family NAD(P)-dependent oxidoreductase, partial [Anoxybacillus sp. LAT_38]|nr:SDR family NAD(P)-dependent oxidoreductase [Anoxybacillus sp. LAT_38]